ncbi:MAG: hypothetical protein C0591_04665 [Marinilabiliales bacterium]|nr:MAG: hypothetical protein C0591_04665 [Marinilabiliales bacterium]
MGTHRKIVVVVILLFFCVPAFAQFDTEGYDSTENLILYQRQRTFGVVLHNLGLGVQYRFGKRVNYFQTRMWEIEFVSMKSYKQIKVLNPYFTNSRRYVYGKLNDAFFLRGGMIWKKLLNRKPYWGGVELRWMYGGGFSLGIAKPYYLYVLYFYETGNGYFAYDIKTERFDASSQSWDDIYGRAPFTVGLTEITLHPGIYLKTGLNFEFGVQSTKIKALEIGAAIDISPMGLSIMANNNNQIFFPTGYLTFSFGKRYNKY